MDDEHLAFLGLSRIRLPIPMVKLQIIHSAAELLQKNDLSIKFALLSFINKLNLESQVLEVLCILILAKQQQIISSTEVRSAIRHHSILSDFLIAKAYDLKIIVNSWENSHSGEAPDYFKHEEILNRFAKEKTVSLHLFKRIYNLENDYYLPFLKQWAFEFECLSNQYEETSNGQFSYFLDDDRQRSTASLLGNRGHMARSAYLRTLALASKLWGMPEGLLHKEASYLLPIDLVNLVMLPGFPPTWAESFHSSRLSSHEGFQKVFENLNLNLKDEQKFLLHFNAPISNSKNYMAEGELISILVNDKNVNIEQLFQIHDFLPGHRFIERHESTFVMGNNDSNKYLINLEGISCLPILVPQVNTLIGYLELDLVSRMPYLPVTYSNIELYALNRKGGADISIGENQVGEFSYWNWGWKPSHDKDLSSNCGISVTISPNFISQLFQIEGMYLVRVWRVKLLTREQDYGEWKEESFLGML